MAGDIHASLRGAAIQDSRLLRNSVLRHLDDAADGVQAWGAAFGGYGGIAGDGNAAGLHHQSAGFLAGADMMAGDGLRLGVAAAYTANSARTADHAANADGDSAHLLTYANWRSGALDLRLGADMGWGNATIVRAVPQLSQSLTGGQDTHLGQVFAEGGYRIEAGQAHLEPYAGFTHVAATSGAFDESGGSAALSGKEKTDSQTFMALGMRMTLPNLFDDSRLTPWGDIAWQHAFGRLRPDQTLRLTDAGQDFTVLGAPLDLDSAAIQTGFDFALKPNAVLTIGYDGTFGSRAQANALRGGFAWRF
jgi:outer membrane autotransporter protein